MAFYDILIPLQDGHIDLADCLEAVFAYTAPGHRILLLDDATTDERLQAAIARHIANPAVVHLRHKRPLGLADSLNRGLSLDPHRDVVLLDPGTRVSPGWLERLERCAQLQPRVATVSALASHSAFFAAPLAPVVDALAAGLEQERLAAHAEAMSLRLALEVPFMDPACVLVRREALVALGGFEGPSEAPWDAWSARASHRGWRHFCDDATLVFRDAPMPTPGTTAPAFEDVRREFLVANPLEVVLQNLQVLPQDERPHLLFVLHNPVDVGIAGGTEVHVRHLVEGLSERFRCFVAYVREGMLRIDDFCTAPTGHAKQALAFPIEDPGYQEVFTQVMEALRIDLLHVHHFIGHPLSQLLEVVREFRGPKVVSIHDYFAVCPRHNLMYKDLHYCNLTRNAFACASCIHTTLGWDLAALDAHRAAFRNALPDFDRWIFPSESVRDDIVAYHDLAPAKAVVVPHGLPSAASPMEPASRLPGEPLRVAFIGAMAHVKGLPSLRRLIAEHPSEQVEWHLWGFPRPDLPTDARGKIVYHGPYERAEIVGLLHKARIHLGLLPSLCPETYSFTLSEFYQARIPVLGSRLGALGERIARDRTGWTLPPDDVSAMIRCMLALEAEPSRLEEIRAAADFAVPSLSAMCLTYAQLYDQLRA